MKSIIYFTTEYNGCIHDRCMSRNDVMHNISLARIV